MTRCIANETAAAKAMRAAIVLSAVLLICGCGGNGPQATRGRLKLTVQWPPHRAVASSRVIPAAADTIVVTVTENGQQVATTNPPIQRPQASYILENIPAGTVSIRADAYAAVDQTHTKLATGAVTGVSVVANSTTAAPAIVMGTTIATVNIAAPSTTQAAGSAATFGVTALDRNGNVVLVAPSVWQWSSSNGAVVTAAGNPATGAATVTALAPGQATITAVDAEDPAHPVSASVTLTVTSNAVGLANSAWPKFHTNNLNNGLGHGSASTGATAWTFQTGAHIDSSPAIGPDGTLYIGASDGNLYAVDGHSGAKKWSFHTGAWIFGSPTVGSDGTIYVGSNDNNVYAINGATGAQKWLFATGGYVKSAPALDANGTLYVASQDGNLYALDSATGNKKWQAAIGATPAVESFASSPAVGGNGAIYVGSNGTGSVGGVYAFNSGTGAQLWMAPIQGGVYSSPAIGPDGAVYVGGNDGVVRALDPVSGASRWGYNTAGRVLSTPAVGPDGNVYVGTENGYLFALNGAAGTVIWLYKTNGNVNSSPALSADGTLYFGSFDKNVYALTASSGAVKWKVATGALVDSSPAIGPDGTVYVGGYDGNLYSLH